MRRPGCAVSTRVWGDSLPGGPGAASSAGRYLAVSRSPERISISRYWSDSVPLAGLSAARKAKKSCGAMVSVIWICSISSRTIWLTRRISQVA